MHPSTALAAVLVDELVRGGVREAVLAPGSRSAPLAYALEEADRAGRLRLHVRIDERTAGFVALGLARAGGVPVPVVTTSGTAVANLHPAVLEAHHSGVPLVVLSADRPAELRGTGANQTTVQPGLFAGAVRWEADLPAPESVGAAAGAHWRSTVCRALAAARSDAAGLGGAGPVHLNVSFRDPLAPALDEGSRPGEVQTDGLRAAGPSGEGEAGAGAADGGAGAGTAAGGAGAWAAAGGVGAGAAAGGAGAGAAAGGVGAGTDAGGAGAGTAAGGAGAGAAAGEARAAAGLTGRAGGAPWVQVAPTEAPRTDTLTPGERTLVLLGDLPDPVLSARALAWAEESGWPVLAEPFGHLPAGPGVVPHAPLVAARVARGDLPDLRPERVVVVGRLTLFRELGALLRLPGMVVEHVAARDPWTDPSHVVSRVHGIGALREAPARHTGAGAWVAAWVRAGAALSEVVAATTAGDVTGLGVARTVADALGEDDVLVVGSSTAPRDLALALDGSAAPARVIANRGLAGIDGTVSTAVGVALAAERRRLSAHLRRGSTASDEIDLPRVVALMGDLTFLHDAGGLLIGPEEPRPDLTIVVVNDDGGGIFSTLEYGDPARLAGPDGADRAAATERIFGTPHGTDLAALSRAYGVVHERVASLAALREALADRTRGLRVLEVPLDRASHRRVRDALG
ncbi:2-succinyl-5-enolpyruvyl-6-hydroxy-3-cyclohexene-1-carboxylic-acid synthase [Serinicoccus profundi]|uniref:2-succinyl-5-enolpyruvyl-6-hydroxy-3- cyclohexene-1-carboxylic-acid synthase n=1 Tax=Serinicoccus profundi TaxID=1078471 RepID=UPI000527835E|nr:2-succinyl-5-enolpyruvyl-6-hydroxy-3-cyclohexene-1-carboxylic-acid synthase [Serinicoccus profundi]